jgi:hypothetical protein
LCRAVFTYFSVYDIAVGRHYGIKTYSKCKRDNEVKKSYKAMPLDVKINIVEKLRGGVSAAAFGITSP